MYLADMAMASVSVGMTALRRSVPLAMIGSRPSLMERNCMSSIATKKFGMEFPMKLKKRRM